MLLTIRSSETVLHKLTTVFWYIHDEFFCRRSPNINPELDMGLEDNQRFKKYYFLYYY
ncbi:hypothetical protein HanRHA438_Chr10g0450011 [Helianthus annuus]|uniref:Uncharacterized protein n=1 Tax=Helianthus annuus TaxID=4232 RepID=A0A9K3HXU3_HELAN|nr:hypothetical protein HanXRQr2_Chr10g0437961 [Helianthus annuus]KAJ0879314.1 hypothetical protein HanRHA438_Chr10g0450011 [Helianthus annuus]KAJ0883543.1 hypothetical protein HanPSC8_Chr10g0422791 [Helianthus annuus]